MNIKNLNGLNPIATPIGQVGKVERQIKSESSQDRDAAGQYFQQKKKQKEKMTEEQFEKALSILKEKAFIKEMNWQVMPVIEDGFRYAWVQDLQGASIRKISEWDLWEIFDEPATESNKGQLLKKTA
ncbi:MAG: hypothetical protein H7328_13495 [Bdellovibrio sp.]|nr:hypothetical protein [Bdellovibrio sp.]